LGSDEASVIDSIAVVRPAACFLQRGVNFRRGLVESVREGFNVRFDIYEGSMSGKYADRDYQPAQNVRKGYVVPEGAEDSNDCGGLRGAHWPILLPNVMGLLPDRTWPNWGSMGEGDWDFNTYWQVNHGGDGGDVPTLDGEPAGNAGVPSRYRVYRYEIEHGLVGDVSLGGESGAPACFKSGGLSAVPDRRILHAAIINCQNLQLTEDAESVPVAAFGKFFLTLPLQRSQTDLYVEFLGLVRPGDGVSYDIVQLYR